MYRSRFLVGAVCLVVLAAVAGPSTAATSSDTTLIYVSRADQADGQSLVPLELPAQQPPATTADGGANLQTRGVQLLRSAQSGLTLLVESVAVTGDTPTADDNDFTRINEALQATGALGDGTIVRLVGTFDWTESNAFASWAANDYLLLAPAGVANVTFGAQALGEATILGPGDLPDLYWEGFLYMYGGTYQGWTVENLDIRGFDWSISMMYDPTGGSTEDFNGVTVAHNHIEMPRDLNAVVAPEDSMQNVGIHLGFGSNQTIADNEILIPGDSVSDTTTDPANPSHAANVALQSNTSGGNVYDGLQIINNTIHILHAAAPDPSWIYGIWENSGANTSNITVSGNSFLNDDPANDPAANHQRAFRVTSHSSATSTVTYGDNLVTGANVAIHWIGDGYQSKPAASVLPVQVVGNTLLGNGTGVWVHTDFDPPQANSKANLLYNRLVGNTVGVRCDDAQVTAEDNWWGCNGGPGEAGCDSAAFSGVGFLDSDPWLVLGLAVTPQVVEVSSTAAVSASLQVDSDGTDLGAIAFPASTVALSATHGTVPASADTVGGAAAASFTAVSQGPAIASAVLDNATVSTRFLVTEGGAVSVPSIGESGDTPTADDNDFTRINDVLQLVGDNLAVLLEGTFDWTEPNAAASWALGSDGLAGTEDDYILAAPPGFSGVTFGAATPGAALIQGPGDLPDVNLEGFLGMWYGSYQGWTVENLDIRGFDLSLYCYFTGAHDFDGLTIAHNHIEIPPDLNATVAPADVNQNIGIHLSRGIDQTVAGNEFVVPGTGVSDSASATPSKAATVVLQSSTHGGDAYDGLQIIDNSIHITGAQSSDPEWIYGIWENGHAHTSNITVSGNSFLNESPDNDSALNLQRAFRVTSQSSDTTTVTYADNLVSGANIAIHWIGDNYTSEPPATVLPVQVVGNTLVDNGTGVWVHSDNGNTNSKATLLYNRLAGNTLAVRCDDSTVTAEDNWWGCDGGPGEAGCDSTSFSGIGALDTDPWLVLGLGVSPSVVEVADTAAATASVTVDSDGTELGAIAFPETEIGFSASGGSVPASVVTAAGTAAAQFTAASQGLGWVSATLDNAVATRRVLVTEGGAVTVQSIGESGGTPSAEDNDYTRILNVVEAVGDGVTVFLDGTFDWTEPNAAASWALGNDGIADTGDDYVIAAPPGFDNVTIGAASPGGAVIQGPGDLPNFNLEGFLGMWDGSYHGWTIENLDIRGFDLSIAMFFNGVHDFDGVTIANNHIEIPPDLNANAAPADVNQNIGLHFSFGTDQTISGNEFVLPGTGVSDSAAATPAKASSVVMQSNTSGGAVYDGLQITDNLIRITGAQSSDPEWIYGIWENGHANTSNITVSGNSFINESPGNDPALNLQRAFRVTSQSSDTTTVAYADNFVSGANIAIHWIGDGYTSEPPASALPVLVTGNTLVGNDTGVWVHSDNGNTNSKATLRYNRLAGNTLAVRCDDSTVTAEDNWWGCNGGPGAVGCDSASFSGTGALDTDPWLVLGLTATPTTVPITSTSSLTASLRFNSDEVDTSAGGFVMNGTPVYFAATGGSVLPTSGETNSGLAATTFTAGATPGSFQASATVDNQTVAVPLLVTAEADLSIAIEALQPIRDDGEPVTLTVTVGNNGPADASAAAVSVTVPPEILGATWTCVASSGASCTAAGSGDISDAVDLPASGSVVYTVSGTMPTPFRGIVTSTGSVAPTLPNTDANGANNSATAEVRSLVIFENGFEDGDTALWSLTVGLAP